MVLGEVLTKNPVGPIINYIQGMWRRGDTADWQTSAFWSFLVTITTPTTGLWRRSGKQVLILRRPTCPPSGLLFIRLVRTRMFILVTRYNDAKCLTRLTGGALWPYLQFELERPGWSPVTQSRTSSVVNRHRLSVVSMPSLGVPAATSASTPTLVDPNVSTPTLAVFLCLMRDWKY